MRDLSLDYHLWSNMTLNQFVKMLNMIEIGVLKSSGYYRKIMYKKVREV
jgi:hypothetical protein